MSFEIKNNCLIIDKRLRYITVLGWIILVFIIDNILIYSISISPSGKNYLIIFSIILILLIFFWLIPLRIIIKKSGNKIIMIKREIFFIKKEYEFNIKDKPIIFVKLRNRNMSLIYYYLGYDYLLYLKTKNKVIPINLISYAFIGYSFFWFNKQYFTKDEIRTISKFLKLRIVYDK